MDAFELSIDRELFRVSERVQANGLTCYDFAWINGPADGAYGFSVGFLVARHEDNAEGGITTSDQMPDLRTQLTEAAREFVEGFYAPGGIGEEDFPDHLPANHD